MSFVVSASAKRLAVTVVVKRVYINVRLLGVVDIVSVVAAGSGRRAVAGFGVGGGAIGDVFAAASGAGMLAGAAAATNG